MAQHNQSAAFEPLRNESASPDIELVSPTSRKPYRRQLSWANPEGQYQQVSASESETTRAEAIQEGVDAQGLGLSGVQGTPPKRLKRVPVGSKEILVGLSMAGETQATPSSRPEPSYQPLYDDPTATAASLNKEEARFLSPQTSKTSLREQHPAFRHISSEANLLHHDHPTEIPCPTQGDVLKPHWGWLPITIVILGIFSTVFSGIFFAIAVKKPRWGYSVGTKNAKLSYSNATLLTALFSKLIELSFACVFVATLGQILSRRAFVRSARTAREGGISIAEMNMRLWILQPGTLITHWDGVKYTFKTVLGALALISALAAAFYITAAEALVSPKLAFGEMQTRSMTGPVSTIFANADYLNRHCDTPILVAEDDETGQTCMQIKYAGQGFRNLDLWMADWMAKIRLGEPIVGDARPAPVATLYDNTTVRGQWITPHNENITQDSSMANRLVHNITMAMPHTNVIKAASDSANAILGPNDLGGLGEYYVQASVPAPALNVLCVGVTAQELEPLLSYSNLTSTPPKPWPVRTAVDDLFGWDMATGNGSDTSPNQKPYFEKLPGPYNTVVSKAVSYGPNAIYLIATPPNATLVTAPHLVCAMRSFMYQDCATSYRAAQSGGELNVTCRTGSPHSNENIIPFSDVERNVPYSGFNKDWPVLGIEWLKAVALSHNANASSARELTQMTPLWVADTPSELPTTRPSIGESLAVLAGATLLMSAEDSPFVPSWNYTQPILDPPKHQYFEARVAYKDYASGASQIWQGVFFYPTLLTVFLLNIFCLAYLIWMFSCDGEVTDYTEPQNLFALAINSPPSYSLAGSCGGGPHGDMLRKKWMVEMSAPGSTAPNTPGFASGAETSYSHSPRNHDHTATSRSATHPHFYVRCHEDDTIASRTQTPTMPSTQPYSPPAIHSNKSSPLLGGFGFKKVVRRVRPRSMQDWTVDQSPAVDQYMRLANR